jgi:hypothetical protein
MMEDNLVNQSLLRKDGSRDVAIRGLPMVRKESKARGKKIRLTRNHMSNCTRRQDSGASVRKLGRARGSVEIPNTSREVKMAMRSTPTKLN